MGNVYTASNESPFLLATAGQLCLIALASNAPVLLRWLELMQHQDLGDAQEEVINIELAIGSTGGYGGGPYTSIGADDRAPTAKTTVYAAAAVSSTGGNVVWEFGWNIRQAGPLWIPIPETCARISKASGDYSGFRLLSEPRDPLWFNMTLCWEEI